MSHMGKEDLYPRNIRKKAGVWILELEEGSGHQKCCWSFEPKQLGRWWYQQHKWRIRKSRWLETWEDIRFHFRHIDLIMVARYPIIIMITISNQHLRCSRKGGDWWVILDRTPGIQDWQGSHSDLPLRTTTGYTWMMKDTVIVDMRSHLGQTVPFDHWEKKSKRKQVRQKELITHPYLNAKDPVCILNHHLQEAFPNYCGSHWCHAPPTIVGLQVIIIYLLSGLFSDHLIA